MKKTIKISLLSLATFVLLGSMAVAKSDKAKANPNADKDKEEVIENFKDFEKPATGQSNADVYEEKINKVSSDLSEVAEKGKSQGEQKKEENTERKQINNPGTGAQVSERAKKSQEEIAEELEEISEEVEEIQEKTGKSMKKVENQNNFKKFLIGTDYKNLGQLRSSLVQNRNQIRQLTGISEELENKEDKEAVEGQLMVLMQERERIKNVITENEEGFSLFGWAFRLMNGYPKDSIDETEEAELEEEVAEVLIDNEEETKIEVETEEDADLLQ